MIRRRILMMLVGAGVFAFAAFLLLSAFGDDFRSGADGGGHALSPAATGFAAIAALDQAARGGEGEAAPAISRDARTTANAWFVVLTPDGNLSPERIKSVLSARQRRPTLIVLDKWQTAQLPEHRGWVRQSQTVPWIVGQQLGKLLPGVTVTEHPAKPGERLTWIGRPFTVAAPKLLQSIAARGLAPMLVARDNSVVLGRLPGDAPVFVLADPDLLDNQAMRTLDGARAGVALLDQLPRQGPVTFDVTLNGYERSRNLLRLVLTPPFLPATLCLFAAALLAGGHALARFGQAEPPPRAFAWGSRALVDNAADLVRQAKREPAAARRYADMMMDAAMPRGLTPSGRDAFLGKAPGGGDWPDLALAASDSLTPAEALAAARALYSWKQRIIA